MEQLLQNLQDALYGPMAVVGALMLVALVGFIALLCLPRFRRLDEQKNDDVAELEFNAGQHRKAHG